MSRKSKAPPSPSPASVRAPGLGFVVSKLSRRIVWRLARETAAHGVMPAQFPVLRVLNARKESTQMELSRLCGIEQPSMAVTLNRMENSGLIQRRTDAADARRKLVTLTPHGYDMLHLMTDSAHAVYAQAAEGLTDDEIAQFLDLCERMTRNLERAGGDEKSAKDLPSDAVSRA